MHGFRAQLLRVSLSPLRLTMAQRGHFAFKALAPAFKAERRFAGPTFHNLQCQQRRFCMVFIELGKLQPYLRIINGLAELLEIGQGGITITPGPCKLGP